MKKCFVLGATLLLFLNLLSVPGRAAMLRVDFNDNDAVANPPGAPAPSPTQSGWLGVTQTGATGVATSFGTLDISVVPIVGSSSPVIDDRDRGQLSSGSHPLSNLLRDLLFITANPSSTYGNGTLDVVLSGLVAGQYTFTGYFHDNSVNHYLVDLAVSTDGGSTYSLMVDDALASTTTNPTTVGSGSFQFTADGTNTVRIRVIGQGATSNPTTAEAAIINGFELDSIPVPEPTMLAFLTLLGPALCYLRHRETGNHLRSTGNSSLSPLRA